MQKIKIITFLSALILSLCFLELSYGQIFSFRVVWWFYFYFVFFLFDFFTRKEKLKNFFFISSKVLIFYFFSSLIFVIHYFIDDNKYDTSSSDFFNIVWWSTFGLLLIFQFYNKSFDLLLFWRLVFIFVFLGSIPASIIGLIKYNNLINGLLDERYYYNEKLIPGSSLSPDYNIYSLGILIATIFSFELQQNFKSFIVRFIYITLIVINLSAVFFSGSRRGLLMIIAAALLLINYKNIKKIQYQGQIIQYLFLPLFLISIFGIFWDEIVIFLESLGIIDYSISRIFTIADQLTGQNDRTVRYDWALNYFSSSSISEIFFGQGFEYLSRMGAFFGEKEDHPHNFILATLLYGGIIGLILILFLIFKILNQLFYFNKNVYFIFILFLFFSLTSSNSLFSYRFFPIIVILSSVNIVIDDKFFKIDEKNI